MSVNQTEKSFFDLLVKQRKEIDENKPFLPQIRENVKEIFKAHAGILASVPYEDQSITVRDGASITTRVFNPTVSGPVIFFLPGNAFLFDLFESNAVAASRIALHGHVKVIMINCRLMPENPWPTAINDIEDGMLYILEHANEYQIDKDSIFLSGMCTGAQVAVLAALRNNVNIPIKQMVLINGIYDQTFSQNAYSAYEKEDGMIDRTAIDWWFDYYSFTKEQAKESDYSPLFSNKLHTLPRITMLIAEYDGFRSDSEAFYIALNKAGVVVDKILMQKQTHNTLILRKSMCEGIDPAIEIVKALGILV